MSRLKELRKYLNNEISKMPDEDERTAATIHLYGVSLACVMLARSILEGLALTSPEENDIICSAIYHHDDKYEVDSPMDELLKDADVISHTMNDPSKPIKEKEQKRYDSICAELGLK